MKLFAAGASAALFLGLATAAQASDEFTLYGDAEGWNVFVNETVGHCMIERAEENRIVQMGISKENPGQGYIGVFTQGDIGLRNKKKVDVVIDLDEQRYTGTAKIITKGITEGYEGGYILADNPNFVEDLAKRYTMIVYPESQAPLEIDLEGTYEAMKLAAECEAAQSS